MATKATTESKATKTYGEVFAFVNVATRWLKNNKEESKLRYAVKKVMKSLDSTLTGYQEKIEDINIEHCSETEDGIIRKDATGNFEYTKENLRKRNEAIRKLQTAKVPVTPFFTPVEEDASLSEVELEAFDGFVIKVETTGPVAVPAVVE